MRVFWKAYCCQGPTTLLSKPSHRSRKIQYCPRAFVHDPHTVPCRPAPPRMPPTSPACPVRGPVPTQAPLHQTKPNPTQPPCGVIRPPRGTALTSRWSCCQCAFIIVGGTVENGPLLASQHQRVFFNAKGRKRRGGADPLAGSTLPNPHHPLKSFLSESPRRRPRALTLPRPQSSSLREAAPRAVVSLFGQGGGDNVPPCLAFASPLPASQASPCDSAQHDPT